MVNKMTWIDLNSRANHCER